MTIALRTPAAIGRKRSWFLHLLPGLLRLHRASMLSIAAAYLFVLGSAAEVVREVGHPRPVIMAGTLLNGNLYRVATYAFFLPVLVAAFVGAPLIARLFETKVMLFAWTQEVGRRRFIASSLLVLTGEVLVLSVATGFLVQKMYFDLYPQFGNGRWQVPTFHAGPWTLALASMFGLLLGCLIGLLVKRTVAAMALTLVMETGIYFLGLMNWLYSKLEDHFAAKEPFNFHLPHSSFADQYNTWQLPQRVADQAGQVHSIYWFYDKISTLPAKWQAIANNNPLSAMKHLGLHAWTPVLSLSQTHNFLLLWCGLVLFSSGALLIAIFMTLGGNDRLFGR